MPFESTIRDFVIKVSDYRDKLERNFNTQEDFDIRILLGTRMLQLGKLISACYEAISSQISFEQKLKDNNEINYPDG